MPKRAVFSDHLRERGFRTWEWLHARRFEFFDDFGILESGTQSGPQLFDDRPRGLCRRDHALPSINVVVRYALFLYRRDIRESSEALFGRYPDSFHLAVPNVADRNRWVHEDHRRRPRQEILNSGGHAAVAHRGDVYAGALLEELHAHLIGVTNPARAIIQLSR